MRTKASSLNSFHFQNEFLFCEELQIDNLLDNFPVRKQEVQIGDQVITTEAPSTPAYIYSSAALRRNAETYISAMEMCDLNGVLGYAVKANGNLEVMGYLKKSGVEILVTVSGNEILAGLKVGFPPNKIILNGNGKQSWEIKMAVEQGVLLNVDSIFDAQRIARIAKESGKQKTVQVLLRVRPSLNQCDVSVHPYVNTSEDSKFGFSTEEMDQVLSTLQEAESIRIIGIHCHLGSCLTDPGVYSFMGTFVTGISSHLREKVGHRLEFLDIGGGIGVDYHATPPGLSEPIGLDASPPSLVPNVTEFIQNLANVIPKGIKVIVEPGRSLVADAGILVSKVLGTKDSPSKKFLVLDAAMTELIRPCLYGSHHQIYPTKLNSQEKWFKYDVVGPVCESADFLGQNVLLQGSSKYVAVMDCGAYASSMSSNYNMRPKPAEILVDGAEWKCIRQRETFQNIFSTSPADSM